MSSALNNVVPFRGFDLAHVPPIDRDPLEMVGAGIRVFPVQTYNDERAKAPQPGVMWPAQATTDPATIRAWWRRWPDAAIGWPVPAGVVVTDLDGEVGLRQWDELWACHGGAPDVPHVVTPNGGKHIYFRLPEGVEHSNGRGALPAKADGGGIDVRGEGGYVLAPGSCMGRGNFDFYEAIGSRFPILNPPLIPEWLLKVLQGKRQAPQTASLLNRPKLASHSAPSAGRDLRDHPRVVAWAERAIENEISELAAIREGGRNHKLNISSMVLGQFVAAGFLDQREAEALLEQACDDNGLTADDGLPSVRKTIASGMTKGLTEPRDVPDVIRAEIEDDNAAIAYGRHAAAPALAQATDSAVLRVAEVAWPEPSVLLASEDSIAPPPLPPGIFGAGWQRWIEASAESKSAPADYIVLGLITAAGALIGNARYASPWSGWTEPPIVNSCLVGLPSSGKSPALDAVSGPLTALQTAINEDWSERQRDFQTRKVSASVVRGTWEKDVRDATDSGHAAPMMPATAEEPAPPQRRRIFSNDPTVAAAERMSAANPRGLLLVQDELAGLLTGMDRFHSGQGSDRAFWLQSYGGRSWLPDRVKDAGNEVAVAHLLWGITGGIQPDRLGSLFLKGDNDGLAARFLYTWPTPRSPARPRHDLVIDDVFTRLKRLRDLPWQLLEPIVIPFSPDAQSLLQKWREEVAGQEREANGLLVSWLGKCPGFAVRLSLILCHLDWVWDGDGDPPDLVRAADVERAVSFLRGYALPMARRCFGEAMLPQAEQDARRLARWLLAHKKIPTTLNERVLRRVANGPGIKEADRLKAALEELAGLGMVREAPRKRIGRPSGDWLVNPRLSKAH